MRKITGLLAASVLLLAACGDDDDNAGSATAGNDTAAATATTSGGSASGVQAQAADEIIKQANSDNLDPDEGCIREKAAGLSDEDAQKIVDNGSSSDTPDLTPAGLAVVAQTMTCLSTDKMLDSVVSDLPEGVDASCVRDKLKDVDFSAIFQSGTLPPEVDQAMTDCKSG